MQQKLILLIAVICSLPILSFAQKKSKSASPSATNNSNTTYTPWAKSLFWKVTPPDGAKPSYLYGTMHVSDKLAFNLPDTFYNALRNIDVVALESDPSKWAEALDVKSDVNSLMNIENPARLRSALGLSQKQNFYQKVCGIQEFNINAIENNLSATSREINHLLFRSMAANHNFEENTFLDLYIFKTATKFNKPAISLEKIQWSLEQMYHATYKGTIANLKQPQKKSNRKEFSILDLEKSYREKDIETLDTFSASGLPSQSIYKYYMIHLRNDTMVKNFVAQNKAGKAVFAAVGAAHLAGEKGMLWQLKQLGYKVEPVIFSSDFNPSAQITALEDVNVPVTFETRFSKDSSLQFRTPTYAGRSYDPNNIEYYAVDMPNGIYYYLSRIRHNQQLGPFATDSILHHIDSIAFESIEGAVLEKSINTFQGYKCFDITSKTKDQKIVRQRIIITPFEVLHLKGAGRISYVDAYGLDTFFNSLKINYSNELVSLKKAGLSLSIDAIMPIANAESKYTNTIYSGLVDVYEGSDSKNNYYLYLKNICNENNKLEEDTFHLQMMAEGITEMLKAKIGATKFIRVDGTKAIQAEYTTAKKEKFHAVIFQSNFFLHYFLIKSEDKSAVDNFFASIKIIGNADLPATYTDSIYGYTLSTTGNEFGGVFGPEIRAFEVASAESGDGYKSRDGKMTKLLDKRNFYNSNQGINIDLSIYELPKFLVMPSIDSFWNYYLTKVVDVDLDPKTPNKFKKMNYQDYSQSEGIYYFGPNKNSVYLHSVYPESSIKYITKLVLGQNKILESNIFLDTLSPNKNVALAELESVRFLDTMQFGKYILESKIDTFIDYITSTDSTKKAYLDKVTSVLFTIKSESPKLISFLDTSALLRREAYILNQFLDEARRYPSKEVYTVFEKIYNEKSAEPAEQVNILRALTRIENKEATQLFIKLLAENPPVISDNGDEEDEVPDLIDNYYSYDSSDTKKLGQYLFPEILTLLDYDEYKSIIFDFIDHALDKKMIDTSAYADRVNLLYIKAKQASRRIEIEKDKLTINREELEALAEEDADAEEKTRSFESIYSRTSNGKIEDMYILPAFDGSSYLELKQYVDLLKPFAYKKRISDLLLAIENTSNRDVLLKRTLIDLDSNRAFDKELIQQYFDSISAYKYALPYAFYKSKRLKECEFAPQTQIENAKFKVMEELQLTAEDTLIFVKKFFCKGKVGSGNMMLFKIVNKDVTSYAAFGLYDKDEKKIYPENFYFLLQKELPKKKTEDDLVVAIQKEIRVSNRNFISKEDVKLSTEDDFDASLFSKYMQKYQRD